MTKLASLKDKIIAMRDKLACYERQDEVEKFLLALPRNFRPVLADQFIEKRNELIKKDLSVIKEAMLMTKQPNPLVFGIQVGTYREDALSQLLEFLETPG